MKKIGMFFAIAIVTILFLHNPIGATTDIVNLLNDPGYGDLD